MPVAVDCRSSKTLKMPLKMATANKIWTSRSSNCSRINFQTDLEGGASNTLRPYCLNRRWASSCVNPVGEDPVVVFVVAIASCSKRSGMETLPASILDSLYAKSAVEVEEEDVLYDNEGAIREDLDGLLVAAPPRKPPRRLRKHLVDLEGGVERKADGAKSEEAWDACTKGAVASVQNNSNDDTMMSIL